MANIDHSHNIRFHAWLASSQPVSPYNARLLYVLLFGTFLCVGLVIHRYYVSPLAKIPSAHPLSPLTQLWMDWRRYSGKEIETAHQAFQQKGPVVRLGPNEIAVNSMSEGFAAAHGHGFFNFDKTSWYDFFANYG